jgi:hypothetical protein
VSGIGKGGAAARAAWNLIDPDAIERTPISLLPDDVGNDVIWVLMLVARSVIRAIASSTQLSYADLRATMWQQLALVREDNPASECVRALLTAWDDPELAQFVTADMLGNADSADVAFEFALLSTSWLQRSRRQSASLSTTITKRFVHGSACDRVRSIRSGNDGGSLVGRSDCSGVAESLRRLDDQEPSPGTSRIWRRTAWLTKLTDLSTSSSLWLRDDRDSGRRGRTSPRRLSEHARLHDSV